MVRATQQAQPPESSGRLVSP